MASQIIGIIIGSFTYGIGYLLFGLLIPWALYIVNLVFSILGFVAREQRRNLPLPGQLPLHQVALAFRLFSASGSAP